MTSVDNAYIVPLHIAGRCSIQAGDSAKLRFTATNNRDAETERLLYITTDAADAVRISPDTGIEIPPGSTITADEPTSRPGAASLDVDVNGLREALEPGMSVDVTFGFDKAGRIEMRTPVEACPRQSPPSP